MNRPALVSASISGDLHDRITRYVSRLPETTQRALAVASPEQAAQMLVRLGAYAPGGLSEVPGGLGWINFVIQAAAAIYGAKKAKDKKKKAQKQSQEQERQAQAAAAAAAAQEAKAKKEAEEAAKRAAAAQQQQLARNQAQTRNWILFGAGAVLLGGAAIFFFNRKRGRR